MKTMFFRNPRVQLLTISASLTCCTFMAGLSAYLTSTDQFSTAFNVATGSDFGIQITGQDPTETILPGDTVSISPTIENTGSCDAYVFVEVENDPALSIDELEPDWEQLEENVYFFGSEGEASVLSGSSTTTPFNDLILDAEESDPASTYDLTVTAYAIQADNVDSNASDAWSLASSTSTTPNGNDLFEDGGTNP